MSLCGVALVLAHEFGHIISAKVLKIPIYEINFGGMSIDILKSPTYYQKSFYQKIILILSGTFLNFFIFMVLLGIYLITRNKFVIMVALQSFTIGVINILPIESLDGGEALKLVLQRYVNCKKVKKISDALSLAFLIPVAFLGIFLIIKTGRNISIILLFIYLIFEKYFI